MKVLFDLAHPAHVNFFKHPIRRLAQMDHEVFVTAIDRGRLVRIVRDEIDGAVHVVGRHRGTKLSIVVEANALKFLKLLRFVRAHRIDVGVSVGGFVLGAVMKVWRRPNLQFDDDPESRVNAVLERLTATRLYYPPFETAGGIVHNYNSLKEWAYLSPQHFRPDPETPTRHGLRAYEYFFVREVSTSSFYYSKQSPNLIARVAGEFPEADYVLSLEDKKTTGMYPTSWVRLEEPVDDIHSLMYFSRAVISSGDSMAREGAMLGVPSFYCGIRKMRANRFVARHADLEEVAANQLAAVLQRASSAPVDTARQQRCRAELLNSWGDTTTFVTDQILETARLAGV